MVKSHTGQRSCRKRKVATDSEDEASADDSSSQEDTDGETNTTSGEHMRARRHVTCNLLQSFHVWHTAERAPTFHLPCLCAGVQVNSE
jgi:hypothetical protein